MAAVVQPLPYRRRPDGRPDLRLVPPRPRRRSAPAGPNYMRRRLAALLVAVALAAALAGAATAVSRAVASSPPKTGVDAPSQRTYVVRPGDTVWSVARALHPSGDVRPVVDRLTTVHGGPTLRVGEVVSLP